MNHTRESQLIENLRQDRRHAKPPPPKDTRPRTEVMVIDRQAFFKLPSNRLGPEQRQFQFVELTADDARRTLLESNRQGRRALPALGRPFAGERQRKEADYMACRRLNRCRSIAPQRAAQGRRGHERQIQQVRFARIIILPRSVQEVKGCLKSCPGFLAIAAAGSHRRGQQLAARRPTHRGCSCSGCSP